MDEKNAMPSVDYGKGLSIELVPVYRIKSWSTSIWLNFRGVVNVYVCKPLTIWCNTNVALPVV